MKRELLRKNIKNESVWQKSYDYLGGIKMDIKTLQKDMKATAIVLKK